MSFKSKHTIPEKILSRGKLNLFKQLRSQNETAATNWSKEM